MSSNIPNEFSGVTAVCKANVYFDGRVVSHTIRFPDGSKKTLGIIYPGEYHFATGAPERMQIVAGSCRVKVDGNDAWQGYSAQSDFRIAGNSGFTIAVSEGIAEYICSFE